MATADERPVDKLVVRQKDIGLAPGYVIRPVGDDGVEAGPVGFAQQKLMTLNKQVSFFADEARTEPTFGFRAREKVETYTVYDVTDAAGDRIGWFQLQFRQSIARTTWRLVDDATAIECVGRERRLPVALARRGWNLLLSDYLRAPLPFHSTSAPTTGPW